MLKKIILYPILLINLLVSAGFLVSGFSYKLPPADFPILSLASLVFPAFAIGVFCFLIFWLFCKWKYAAVSLLTLVIGYIPMHKYSPFSPQADDTSGTLKVISYNVHCFMSSDETGDTSTVDLIARYLIDSKADIICLQEADLREGRWFGVREKFENDYKYMETFSDDTDSPISCLSKTPIERVEQIKYESAGNRSACFYIKYHGRTLRVINNHFETTGMESDDKAEFRSIVKGAIDDEYKQEGIRRIARCISRATVKRQAEAEAVADFIGDDAKNTIAVGDFNDTPLSYAHATINDKLTDCYAAAGRFPGFSFEHSGMHVRIDHAFCSDDFDVAKCYVDDEATFSDHYPIITCLSFKKSK